MTRVPNLLDINVDKLFRENSASYVRSIKDEIQVESERKREELRTMVGEKYRDLLKAADTISEMKGNAQSLVGQISNIINLCKALQDKHLIGFRESDKAQKTPSKSKEEVAQIFEVKLYLSMSEEMWCATNVKSLFLAAEKYLFASHIGFNLQIGDTIRKYPLLKQQMITVDNLRFVIMDSARQELQTTNLSAKDACDALCALLLLQLPSMEDLLSSYLDIRLQKLQDILTANDGTTVKDKLQLATILIQHTFMTVAVCFTGPSCLIVQSLLDIRSDDAVPTIKKLLNNNPLMEKHLSPIIKSFKPDLSPKSLSKNEVEESLTNWLSLVENILNTETVHLLSLVVNLKGVRAARDKMKCLKPPIEWNQSLFSTLRIEISSDIIQAHLHQRARQLIESSWESALTNLIKSLTATDIDIKSSQNQNERDLQWFIWKESDDKSVSWKTRGFTPRVIRLCDILNEQLQILLDDVSMYADKGEEDDRINDHLNKCSYNMMQRLGDTVKTDLNTLNEASIILRARFFQALQFQCSNLEKCVRHGDQGVGISWRQILNILNETNEHIWRHWKDTILKLKIQSLINDKLDSEISLVNFLFSKPACEIVKIEEEAEDNTRITSELHVPSQPSFKIQELLFQICLLVNCVAVHTLPRIIHQELTRMVSHLIFAYYEQILTADTIYPSQAWQLLLDIRFLSLILLSQDDQSLAQGLIQRLENVIDPFDLNVCYPYLQNNVKKSANRLQGTFGVLIDYSEKLAVLNSIKVMNTNQATSPQHQEEPNVLAMASSSTTWFPLLPVSTGNGAGGRKNDASPGKSTGKTRGTKKESATTDFVRSAGAFFGWT